MNEGSRQIERVRYPDGLREADVVAVEEPLEIRVDGEPLAVLMRTPGDDRALTAGFLVTEGVIDGPDDLVAIAPCTDPNRPQAQNTFLTTLAVGCAGVSRLDEARRHFFATSSCGLCGKATIERIHQSVAPNATFLPLSRQFAESAGERAHQTQTVFRETGGLHAAVLFGPAPNYTLLTVSEDIGRHNAVDKMVGQQLLGGRLPLTDHTLWLSGRASFEVVQKALMAGVSAVISVGAPSSLAVELAEKSRVTLLGFARGGGRFNVYTGTVTAH